jgi:hypothetical protein
MINLKQILISAITISSMCAMSSCTLVSYLTREQGDGSGGSTPSFRYRHEGDRYAEWCWSLPNYIIPRMCAYYALYPERFKPTGHGEEIEISGFAAFVKNDSYFKSGTRCYIINGTIMDPWGQPLHFVQDLNMDGYIEALGERRAVSNLAARGQETGRNQEHHFGICKQSPFKVPYGEPYERIIAVTY